jgi:lipopolysaccharide export LptBFGC system permease protein LptF
MNNKKFKKKERKKCQEKKKSGRKKDQFSFRAQVKKWVTEFASHLHCGFLMLSLSLSLSSHPPFSAVGDIVVAILTILTCSVISEFVLHFLVSAQRSLFLCLVFAPLCSLAS